MSSTHENEFQPDVVPPPGETLLETIEALGMSQAELAERTGRPKKTINEIIKGKAAITPETALQLERVLGVPASFWNNYERSYREHLARRAETESLARHKDWLKNFPVRAMMKLGWIPESRDKVQQVRSILRYFAIAAPEQWNAVWVAPVVAYRKARVFSSDSYVDSVWLRQGQILAQKMECRPFDDARFRNALVRARALTREPANVWHRELQSICADAGVVVVLVPELPKLRVCGATYWLASSKAVIQLSLRYKTDDHFWFTFFHEAGHILLHGRTETFIEGNDAHDEREDEANRFAAQTLIPELRLRAFLASGDSLTKKGIAAFAEEMGIAPGIVVRRLQKEGRIPYSHCNELKRKLEWTTTRQLSHHHGGCHEPMA